MGMSEVIAIVGLIAVLGVLHGLITIWADKKMGKAMDSLREIRQIADREISMGCNCHKKAKNPEVPCDDPTEESFRVAFLNETKKAARYSAERYELQNRLELTETFNKERIRKLELHIQALEHYAIKAFENLPDKTSFQKAYGAPPITLKVANGR